VLDCADARVPVELIFNEGPNDLFVVRVAGITLGEDVRGSLKYALEHLGESLRLIVVLGHSGCGAVTAAVDVFLDPSGYLSLSSKHSIRSLVDRLQVVVQASAKKMHAVFGADIAHHPHYREALIELSVVMNAALAAHTLQREIGAEAADGVRTAYGVYLLAERTVWAPRGGSDDVTGPAAPLEDLQGFVAFGDAVFRSERITWMLAR
jgi:carbonic anhydrase